MPNYWCCAQTVAGRDSGQNIPLGSGVWSSRGAGWCRARWRGCHGEPTGARGCKGDGKIHWSQHRLFDLHRENEEKLRKSRMGEGERKAVYSLSDGMVCSSGGIKLEDCWDLLSIQRNVQRQTRNMMKFSISLNLKNIFID